MKIKDDVIIIGSGLGGLPSGSYLANKGYKVKIFEKLNMSGGYVNTFKRKDYLFENSTHFMAIEPYVLKLIGLNEINILKLKDSIDAFYFKDDKVENRFTLTSGKKNIYDSLVKNFHLNKKEAKTIINLFNNVGNDIKRLYKVLLNAPFANVYDMITALFFTSSKDGSFAKKIGNFSYKNMHKINNKNLSDALNIINNPYLKSILEMISSACFLIPPEKSFAFAGIYLNWAYLINHSSWIKGGTKKVIDCLIENFKNNNGEINYSSEVKEILTKDKNAIGVKLENGECHFAKYIIANTNAYSLFKSLIKDNSNYSEALSKKLDNYISSSSIFQVYLGLPFDIKDFGYKSSANLFYNDLDINKLFKRKPNLSDPDFFLLTNYSAIDDAYSPKGKSSIVIATKADYKEWENLDKKNYQKQKAEFEKKIIEKTAVLTGLPLHRAEVVFSATPITYKFYSGNIRGGIMGLERSINFKDRFGHKTEINNLFIAGADSGIGGGFNAAIYSGIIAAKQITMPNISI